jgi:hypothetical protein
MLPVFSRGSQPIPTGPDCPPPPPPPSFEVPDADDPVVEGAGAAGSAALLPTEGGSPAEEADTGWDWTEVFDFVEEDGAGS